ASEASRLRCSRAAPAVQLLQEGSAPTPRAQQAEQRNNQRSLAFHFGAYGGNADGVRSLSDSRLQPLRFPSDLSYSPRDNVREFMCMIRKMLETHLWQHSDEGTSKVLNRVTKEIQRVQTSWL